MGVFSIRLPYERVVSMVRVVGMGRMVQYSIPV